MNAATWRTKGFRSVFRSGRVLLVRAPKRAPLPSDAEVYTTAVGKGAWLSHDDLAAPPWERVVPDAALRDDLDRTLRVCYCDEGVGLCDFCAGLRRPPETEIAPPAPLPGATILAGTPCGGRVVFTPCGDPEVGEDLMYIPDSTQPLRRTPVRVVRLARVGVARVQNLNVMEPGEWEPIAFDADERCLYRVRVERARVR